MKPTDSKTPAEGVTRGRLLDAAEELFGRLGYEGASVRAITHRARTNLGSITYHFGSKEALYNEAFFRRVRPANARRLAELVELRAATPVERPLAVAGILRCLLRAPLLLAGEHPGFVRLLARNLTMPPPFAFGAIRKEMDPLEGPFFTELARALPELPPPVIRFHLMLSGGGLFFLLCHLPQLEVRRAAGLIALPALPPELALEWLVQFAAAGLTAPAPASPPTPASPPR